MEFKLLDPVLWMNIQNQIDDDFGTGVTKELVGDLVPISLESESGMSVYLSPMSWIDIMKYGLGSFELYYIGLILGEITKGIFRLSISILSRLAPLTNNRIIISDKGVGPFTYGKSILKESILEIGKNLRKGQRVLILNENHDCLGLATMTTDGYRVSRMQPVDLVAKNLADVGLYFRKFI